MCHRCSLTDARGNAQPNQKVPPSLVPDNGEEVEIGGPGLANFTPSHIDADRITSVGFRCANAQDPGEWGERREGAHKKVRFFERRRFTDSLLLMVVAYRRWPDS